ncbi:E3 ubiquitin-protein ligase RGLG3 [Physcomitrium patens]|uniref:RING-type domain-containing protein n=1 Tax=Physcomitrium patens TaxID=3218 RepID=A0A2K1K8G3_PHYPA|nr:E3 ubiquitin-protein ligase RGLG4-like [Physcomitrium patens]PNR50067.1 hypothetical protein PHYPA_011964 [Physcomitrium patens]|eukprot:XP_024383266.1 E3 ubiquitin-protein ligase RGLG4-like [Physcomitrella patens]
MGNSGSSSSSRHERSRDYAPPAPSTWPTGPRHSMIPDRSYSMNPRYSMINDNYRSLEEVQRALKDNGLESSNLIVGIDFTKSNEWTGRVSFGGRSLHAIGQEQNPYEKALTIIGTTLSPFDDDNLIPCFGFGDSTTHDKQVFSFYSENRPCDGMEEALARYRAILPHVRLAGPTSFAPIINAAVDIVEESGGQYHVLFIIADGQIEGPQERATVDAIVNASYYPLSIVLVGVGDGPFSMMKEFDDNLPERTFDNFQFINFTEIMQSRLLPQEKEAKFALGALMEIPLQYKATVKLGILGTRRGQSPGVRPRPPPPRVLQMDGLGYGPSPGSPQTPSFTHMDSQKYGRSNNPQAPSSIYSEYYSQPALSAYSQYGGYPPSFDSAVYPPPPAPPGYPPPPSAPSGHPPAPPGYPPPPSAPPRYPSAPAGYPSSSSSAPAPPTYFHSTSGNSGERDAECPVCLLDKKDTAFNCGHQTCQYCAQALTNCPICRQPISRRIRLY